MTRRRLSDSHRRLAEKPYVPPTIVGDALKAVRRSSTGLERFPVSIQLSAGIIEEDRDMLTPGNESAAIEKEWKPVPRLSSS